MIAWRLLPLFLLVAACSVGPPPALIMATSVDETERLVRRAETQIQTGELAEAARLFEEAARSPNPAVADRAMVGLTRVLVHPEYAGRDYGQAYLVADRLVRDYPDSQYTPEARAWRDLLGAYLAVGRELERRTHELDQRTRELERRTHELERLKRLDLELERRTRELERRTHELERLKRLDLELERRTQELERRTQELERLKRLDLELERQRRKP